MFDIFYLGKKPNLFAHEQRALSVDHACEMSRTRYLWIVDAYTDYSQFDWLWEPVPWEAHQKHVWRSQWQQNSGTMLMPKSGSTETNYRSDQVVKIKSPTVIGIDHGDGLTVARDIQTRYISDYLGTLKRVLSKVTDEYVWVVSSVCDYTNFDFTWHPSEWQQDMLHVFASNEQKFGDTFYIHVPTFLLKTQNLALLEWFDTIHFVEDISVLRRPVPVVQHQYDSQVPAVWAHDFSTPVVQFVRDHAIQDVPAINLWRQETKAVVPLTLGAGSVLVPREAKNFLKTQLYDYPVIDKNYRALGRDPLLDIVFIDNGEPNAELNYQHLVHYNNTNTIHRSTGVNGRVAAYQAAAKLSTTPWFFAVFAKLHVNPEFDWSWQPDRLQEIKHYIFHARNPINDLVYGHQAMIAYNKKLVLENPGTGLDFTLDSAHEVVPLLSGQADYHLSKWMSWRTAFRECIKLRASLPDVENEYRLKQWLTVDHSSLKWSQKGAEDAIEYYNSVSGDLVELKKSYDWAWLASYALLRRDLVPDQ
jgi:hypothetical protein